MIYFAVIFGIILIAGLSASSQQKAEARIWSDRWVGRLMPFALPVWIGAGWMIFDSFGPIAGSLYVLVVVWVNIDAWQRYRRTIDKSDL